ncbi:MAG: energy-coupling factor ABC transporter permease [Muribaculaceae bacterium]|nr:energy-coupling factor ABC transporter permease [Muribaculaceae bacterium]
MHMADALVSAPVSITAGVVAAAFLMISAKKVSNTTRNDMLPLMGVMGAFVFAAQMINFSIPGTGSSGHVIGGVLLGALLGPWAAFITLASVLIIQCLLFADGGVMALGCNLVNMGVMTCLVSYPLIYRPIARNSLKKWVIMAASIVACIAGLELGALAVTLETELSGITELPTAAFLSFMLPIHLVIGLCEGIATGVVLCFIAAVRPGMLESGQNVAVGDGSAKSKWSLKSVLWILTGVAVVMAAGFTWLASGNPDGLEWSIAGVTGDTELAPASIPATAILPDYDSTFSGLIGGLIVVAVIWGICSILFHRKKRE